MKDLREFVNRTVREFINEQSNSPRDIDLYNIAKRELENNDDVQIKILNFIENMEHYQSNHYGSFDRDNLITAYNNLPKKLKISLAPNNIDNLYRGADGVSYKSAISFTNNKSYADAFGVYTIPFTQLKGYLGLIDTEKLVHFLDKNGFQHEIGDDEGEVVVLKPIFKKDFIKNIERFRN